jgi:hypothetical protein
MQRFLLIPLLLVALAAGCEGPSTTAPVGAAAFAKAGTTKTNQMVDVTGASVVNPCNGELVIVEGKGHVVTTTTANPDGSTRIYSHINYAGISGVGQVTGLKYQLVAAAKQDQTTDLPAGAYSYEVQEQVGLISQGPTDNYKTHLEIAYGFDGVNSYYITFRDNTGCEG